ncbi:MAG: signal recognition particle-docking protein FtsY [Planctomycetes bacterium]|nr:signal recognition particle-docking protein FtsY [Planctomycetota bacterium]MCC7171916.1 signal recognition particle-docking protein FtsY [Planctomycetota bacterium]
MFKKLFEGLKKTRDALSLGLRTVLSIGRDLDDETLDRLEETLYTADLGPSATAMIEKARKAYKLREIKTTDDVMVFLRKEIEDRLGERSELELRGVPPTVVLMVGVNGSGKTTTIAKLARHFTQQGKKVVIGAGDTFRAAAAEQLQIWADRVGATLVRGKAGADPAAVAFDAAEKAATEKADVLLVDTAGRLVTQAHLMQELSKISRVLGKRIPGAPHDVLLVLDATTGQNAIQQAEKFKAAVPVTGLIVAKLDGSAKGGAVVGIRERVGLPVKFIGVGEKADDLEPFDPKEFARSMFEGHTP